MKAIIWRILAAASVPAYAACNLYGQSSSSGLTDGVLSVLLAYGLAVVAAYGMAVLAYEEQWFWIGASALAGLAAGFLLVGADGWESVMLTVFGTVAAGSVAGHLVRKEARPIHAFGLAAIIIAVVTMVQFLPHWPELRALSERSRDGLVEKFSSGLALSGYNAETQENYRDALKDGLNLVIRLTPASTLLSAVLQLALGYLWFSLWVRRRTGRIVADPFVLWKVPFGVVPVVIVLAALRLLGGDAVKEIADNGLAVTAIVYCFAGLSVVEFTIRRLQIGIFMKIMFYVMLFLTQLIGFLMISLLGFVDSFADWRKISAAKIALKS
jgi:hypothetical protein